MEIPYPSRSKFLDAIEMQVRGHKDEILKGFPVTIDVRNVAKEAGYQGDIVVEIFPENKNGFLTGWESSDPTRFPQRIRVAAWVLSRNRIFGNFKISHNSGILRIQMI